MAFGPNWAKPEPRAQTYMTTKGSRRGIASPLIEAAEPHHGDS